MGRARPSIGRSGWQWFQTPRVRADTPGSGSFCAPTCPEPHHGFHPRRGSATLTGGRSTASDYSIPVTVGGASAGHLRPCSRSVNPLPMACDPTRTSGREGHRPWVPIPTHRIENATSVRADSVGQNKKMTPCWGSFRSTGEDQGKYATHLGLLSCYTITQ